MTFRRRVSRAAIALLRSGRGKTAGDFGSGRTGAAETYAPSPPMPVALDPGHIGEQHLPLSASSRVVVHSGDSGGRGRGAQVVYWGWCRTTSGRLSSKRRFGGRIPPLPRYATRPSDPQAGLRRD